MTARRTTVVPAAWLMASLMTGCGESPTSPTTTDTTPASTTTTYIATLAPGGSRFYSFSLLSSGDVGVMLASVALATSGAPLAQPLALAVGVPAGTDCAPTTTIVATPALVAQLTAPLSPGTYCVRVADPGGLPAMVTFAVRFTHP
jgi:hypothetical protein